MNNITEIFKDYLFSQNYSKVTVKNYVSDISRFVRWYEDIYKKPFSPNLVVSKDINTYLNESSYSNNNFTGPQNTISGRSMKRHAASLKNFFSFIEEKQLIAKSPLSSPHKEADKYVDPLYLGAFKNYLYSNKCSQVTIKNYVLDINQFLEWIKEVTKNEAIQPDKLLSKIHTGTVEEYKKRLINENLFSFSSINRKLSSIRKYISWLYEANIILPEQVIEIASISKKNNQVTEHSLALHQLEKFDSKVSPASLERESHETKRHWFAPYRLYVTVSRLGIVLFDSLLILPLISFSNKAQLLLLMLTGKTFFKKAVTESLTDSLKGKTTIEFDNFIIKGASEKNIHVRGKLQNIQNIRKEFYAPLAIKTEGLPFFKKLFIHAKHKRPAWYRKYHQYPVVHYIHFAVLVGYIGFLLYSFYFLKIDDALQQTMVFAALPTSPPRILTFKGRLADSSNLPITAQSSLRFSLYNSPISSGSALLWQDVITVKPDTDGNFITTLGNQAPLTDNIFQANPNLYVGIAVEASEELRPREQLATAGFAQDTQRVQGLAPITSTNENRNVLLALDSAGNLAIGGSTGTTFQTTDGQFTITGQSLFLTTNTGSDGSLILSPEGKGIIDIQKGIVNSTEDQSSIAPGSVLFQDTVAIVATSSASPALSLHQEFSGGFIISASGSGVTRFTLDDQGNAVFSGKLSVNGNSITTTQTSFSLFPDAVINLSIGASATDLILGATTGNTTIRNNANLLGNLQFGDSITDTISISARLASNLTPGETGKYDLGSSSMAFNNAYLTNLFMTPGASTSGFLRRDNGNVSLVNQNDTFLLGGSNTSSALIKLAAISGEDSFINSGKFGVGTNTSLTDKLHVYGDIRVGTTSTDGCLKRYDGTALVGTCSSDARLKKDIKPIENVLDKVTDLQPVTFSMRVDEFPEYGFGFGTSYGLIAQEVEQIFPHLVDTDERGFKRVSYGPELTMLSISAIKELHAKVKSIETSIEDLDINDSGDLINQQFNNITIQQSSNALSNSYIVKKQDGSIMQRVAAFAQIVSAKLSVGLLNAKEGTFDTLAIVTDQLTVNGSTLRDYIVSVIEALPFKNTTSVTTPKLVATDIETQYISPLSDDSEITLEFKKSEIAIRSNKAGTDKIVANFDADGNATFSGTLAAKDANINGTLRAGRIIADDIAGLDSKIATLAAVFQNNQATQNATESASYIASNNSELSTLNAQFSPSSASAAIASNNVTDSSNSFEAGSTPGVQSTTSNSIAIDYVASVSSSFAYIPNFQTDFSTVTNGLMVYGSTSLADVSVANQLSVGGNLILADNTINVLGASLELQPLRQGNISLMGGLVNIDVDGNLSVNGNALFAKNVSIKGNLLTNTIAPVPGDDLVIKLTNVIANGNDGIATDRQIKDSKLKIQDSSGNSVFTVNSFGEVLASGAATLSSLKIVRGAQADTSVIETTASGSAGVSAITAGYTSRTIYSPYVKEDSLIYVTPRTQTPFIPYLSRQTPEDAANNIPGSFTIQIPAIYSEDIQFNWWIIN